MQSSSLFFEMLNFINKIKKQLQIQNAFHVMFAFEQ
jgi:hypothetical protein